jgi:hypothetical protein
MAKRRPVDPRNVAVVRDLAIDPTYLTRVVDQLASIGSSPLGFRTTGTPEDEAVAAFVSAEMREMGLVDVAIEPVDVDGWRFRSAALQVGDTTYEGSSFGGVMPTPPNGVQGQLIDIGTGLRRQLDTLDLDGSIALLDWRHRGVAPYAIAFELLERGVIAMAVTCPAGGPWYQSESALGAFDGHWPRGGPPMVFIRKEDAATIRQALEQEPVDARLFLDVERTAAARGSNVVGYLPGTQPGPIVVGAHHDGWFRGAFDNASGVAATLAIAKALITSGHQLPYTVCFSSRTAEEYGLADSPYDWCIGAWEQVNTTHPEWSEDSPFHLCVEATGRPGVRAIIETTVELGTWARGVCRVADREGWLPNGWRVAEPVAGTELWPFLVAGVPSVAAYAWETSFGHTDYHSQLDTADKLNFEDMASQTRLYALLLLEAGRDPSAVLDHSARARQLTKLAGSVQPAHQQLAAAAERHSAVTGRKHFTRIGQGLVALDAHTSASYPHAQAAHDIAALEAALSALDHDDVRTAYRKLTGVGMHSLFPYLSAPAYAALTARTQPEAVSRSWASRSHLTTSPNLWSELASLRNEPGCRPFGPWVRDALSRALAASQRDLARRLDDMARSAEPPHHNNQVRAS